MDLDIPVKPKDPERGDYGYVRSQKVKNLKGTLVLLTACFVSFLLGKVIFYRIEIIFNLLSVLLLLPAGQFFARYFSFLRYATMNQSDFVRLQSISDTFIVLGELPLIRGKKDYSLLALVITEIGVYGLIEQQKSKTMSLRQCRSTESVLLDILRPRGLNKKIEVYDDVDVLYEILKNTVKSSARPSHGAELDKIKEAILVSMH